MMKELEENAYLQRRVQELEADNIRLVELMVKEHAASVAAQARVSRLEKILDERKIPDEDLVKLEAAGYVPVLRWKLDQPEHSRSVICTTGEALANIESDKKRR